MCMQVQEAILKSNYDTPWKLVIEHFFKQFMEFFFPDTATEIDWTKPHEFADKELLALEKKGRVGKKISDKLVKVFKTNGDQARVIIHIEIQGGRETSFPRRMFEYFYKIYNKHKMPLMCAAILTDTSHRWRPNCFITELWGCELTLKFPIVKLMDYELGFLDKSVHPIAKIIQAHLVALKTRGKHQLRLEQKLFLMKKLYPLGYTADDIRILYAFIDYALDLPDEIEGEFMKNMKNYEEEIRMPYITSAQRLGRVEGREEGISIGNRNILKMQIEKKFGELTPNARQFLEKANADQLVQIGLNILTAESIEDLF